MSSDKQKNTLPSSTQSPVQPLSYRYPGVTPFSTRQQHIFFGRKQDTSELYRLIRREDLVVLYSKSGLGKSSLLNAGIVPACIEEGVYSPIVVRFGAWTDNKPDTPLSLTKAALFDAFDTPTFLSALMPNEDSLWYHAKSRQVQGGGRPLLLFDQFEELFSYPSAQIQAFQQELAELRHTGLPLRLRRRLEEPNTANLSEEQEDLIESPLESRILFAIRSDRMHLLNRLSTYFPNVLRHSYELLALHPADARDAITMPAQAQNEYFYTPPFSYSPAALDSLLAFLSDKQEGRVEGILLQMLCENFERKQVERLGNTFLDLPQIGDPQAVVRNYYEEKIQSLPFTQQPAARRLIEDGLVSDGESMRLSLHEAYIQKEYGIDKVLLEILVDSRLLRAEPFRRGGYSYELSHDRLVPAVLEARNQRREAEARAEAQHLKAEAHRALRHLRLVQALLGASVIALAFAAWQYSRADRAKQFAENQRAIAEQKSLEAEKALNNFKAAQAAKELLEFTNLENRSNAIVAAGGCPSELFQNMRAIAQSHPDSTQLLEKINILQSKSSNCK